jgi:hypothetical protein
MGVRNLEESDFNTLVFLFLIELFALELVEQSKMWVRWFSGRKINTYGPAELRIGMGARINAIMQTLTDPAAMESLRRLFSGLPRDCLSKSEAQAISQEAQRRIAALGKGIERARAFMSSKEMRDVTLFSRYLKLLEAEPLARWEAKIFVDIAKSRGHDSPELSALEDRAV